MADEDKDRPRDWGHHKSPIFKLPPEIRNKIYHETFAGSERDLVIDPPLSVDVIPFTGRRSIFSTVKSHHHFLLTCFQAYCEALAIYWSLTLVRNGPSRIWIDGHFTRGYFLNRIPAIARQHIQHLRGVCLEPRAPDRWSQDDAIGRHLSPAKSLDLFPNLKSCSFVDGRRLDSYALACSEVPARHPKIDTLTKKVDILPGGTTIPWFPNVSFTTGLKRITFEHFNSGRRLTWYQPQWSNFSLVTNEIAFKMLMYPAPEEIEAIENEIKSNLRFLAPE